VGDHLKACSRRVCRNSELPELPKLAKIAKIRTLARNSSWILGNARQFWQFPSGHSRNRLAVDRYNNPNGK
jgi:hypothetical protein